MKMNAHGGEYNPYCYFHPTEIVVGVCALCLKERLLELAFKQGHYPIPIDSGHRASRRKHSFTLPNFFALGSFLRVETRQQRPDEDNSSDHGSVTSLDDSFISIKFEDNGEASWESKKKKAEEEFIAHSEKKKKETSKLGVAGKSLVEHVKPRGSSLRWRKRIGQLLQLSRWKKSNKTGGAGHVGGIVGKVEGRRGWMRSLTSRRGGPPTSKGGE